MEPIYKQMYIRLFRASEMAVRYLEEDKPTTAKSVLKLAQAQCEELYLDAEEEE